MLNKLLSKCVYIFSVNIVYNCDLDWNYILGKYVFIFLEV